MPEIKLYYYYYYYIYTPGLVFKSELISFWCHNQNIRSAGIGVGIVHKNSVGVGVRIVTKMTGVGIEKVCTGIGIIEGGIAPGLDLGQSM